MNNKYYLFGITTLLVIIADQVSKYAITTLEIKNILLLPFLQLNYATNTGVAFSLLNQYSTLVIILSFAVIVAFLYWFKEFTTTNIGTFFTGLIMGGALGNLIDRIRQGYVVDFIDFSFWPTFNLADSAISIGVIGLLIIFIISELQQKRP